MSSSNMKVTDVKISAVKIEKTKDLNEILGYMEKNGVKNPYSLLPTTPSHIVSFTLQNTFSGFANAVRRVLVGEIPTHSLTVDEKEIDTDDEFIISDVVIKNLNLLMINQEIKEYPKQLSLHVYNHTNDIIDIMSSSIQVGKLSKDKESNGSNTIITHKNIAILRLRPGKYLTLPNITIHSGISVDDAGSFSLLSNVSYKPTGVEPYDQFTGKGTRSIDSSPTSFEISFQTAGNISSAGVIEGVYKVLTGKLNNAKKHITEHVKQGNKYHDEAFEVTIDKNNLHKYVFHGEYFTLVNWLAQQCYLLDTNITHCTSAVERYDNRHGIIRLNHPDPDTLLLEAISAGQKDLDVFAKAIGKK